MHRFKPGVLQTAGVKLEWATGQNECGKGLCGGAEWTGVGER